ncbi:cell differentiation protein rcd1 [Gregarina niphandrodes]|uniref:Cell differentiation protein rcd1 n=1 Tax=Gregarina niphandrodes TaxID=110365 RepID=A0A023B479_GRENI|nr:cell differentiation protein rcd1 [Gregarina niphandrodes]EZG56362.1 cell differentiation protein rcd1 [Gregarina niphandrodes]|eukprot:XP_011131291.1 cell differentiation protein rcd1 [Gregarina niphandrodes]
MDEEEVRVCELIRDIADVNKRDAALHELSKRRETFPQMARYLWFSFGTMAAFLQEIIAVYPLMNPSTLTAAQSQRVCNCLALLQCVACHPETKRYCLKAHIPLYLYPFLNCSSNSKALEFLRLTALGVIGALVKGDDPEVLRFLLQSEVVPLCLRIMDNGNELPQTVATFVVQKVLGQEEGLLYLCATAERFYAVSSILSSMVNGTSAGTATNERVPPTPRLLKHIVKCYLRLCDNRKAREAFKHCLPEAFNNDSLSSQIEEDPQIGRWISQIVLSVQTNQPPTNTD